jgi:hypothetical protein
MTIAELSYFLILTSCTRQTGKMGGSAYSQGAVDELAQSHFANFKLEYPDLQFDNRII